MLYSCKSKKRAWSTEHEVIEALIESQIKNTHGAINYYQCIECGCFHLTSKGIPSRLLQDPEVVKRIKFGRDFLI